MSAKIVAQEIVDDLPDTQGEKAGFGALIAFEIVYYVLGSLVYCMKLRNANISVTVSESYDPGLNNFSPREISQIRRRVKRAALRNNVECSPWQELVTASAIMQKARSPQAVSLCLADTDLCTTFTGDGS